MAAAWAVLAVVMLVAAQAASGAPVMAPAFLWAPKNYGFSSDGAKEVVHYQTISPKGLAKSVLQEGGWSNLVCSREDAHKDVEVAIVFLGSKLQSSDISKDKQVDPALADTLKMMRNWNSLISGFTENCNSGFEGMHITYTDTCAVSGQDLKMHHNMDSVNDLVMARMGNNPSGQTDLILFCGGGFEDLDSAKSEGELLSELVAMLKKSGAKYTILYASQPSSLLESPSNVGRFLAEKTNTTKVGLGKCEGECLVKSTLLEGTFVGIVLLIILISGLMCMMGIDTPSRFEAPQES
ncbi:hypothetical protein PR202_ga04154 [Eleusine coracana subsp. coracana]|uniref:V-type proton ATPase subunit S1/VOA1 transmembrane domain-containing protein n=1 Tax=Eleusine coracana subsp. coracana TaxID=191504 RepID=A0AAV5BQD2_ELECO|nr:hypothetical protein PR202_ga04154 [Eleusine coracana subsp. coracana]